MGGAPVWRRAVDEVDEVLSPLAAAIARSDPFIHGLAVVVRARIAIGNQAQDLSRRLFHALNLPAGSDINRLLTQTASVERAVRDLGRQLEAREEDDRART